MADFPVAEVSSSSEPSAHKKSQFGIALEPEVVKICGYALLVGLIGGLVAQGLLELIYSFTNLLKPIGIARANDILQLRRWLLEEDTGELRRETLDQPQESPAVQIDGKAAGKPDHPDIKQNQPESKILPR